MKQRKNYYGRHRLNTPQNRLKKAVSYRHTGKFKPSTKQTGLGLADAAKSVSKYFSVWKNKVREQTEMDTILDQSNRDGSKEDVLMHPISEENASDKQTKPMSRKEARRKARDQWAEEMVTQPNASFFGTLLHPLRTLERDANSRYISISSIKGFIWTVFAWLCFGLCTARLYVWNVYQMEFSIARYNFTQNVWLAIRIALFGLAAGYLFLLGFYLYGKIQHRTVYYTKLMEGSSLSSLPAAILFLVCYLIMLKINGTGTVLYILCIIVTVCYKFYSLYRFTRYSWIEISILGSILIVILFILYQSYFEFAMKDLHSVYQLLRP